MIYLIIKGTPGEAQTACEARGVWGFEATVFDARFNQTAGKVDNNNHIRLVHWFCEGGKVEDRTGFPVGTLLWHGAPQD